MQCPNCKTLGMDGDRSCIRCGASLASGGRRNLPGKVGLGFAMGMMCLLVVARPLHSSKLNEEMAWSIVCGLACMAAGVVGTVIGWVIQKLTD